MKKILFLLFIICFISCEDQPSSKALEKGYYRVILEVQDQQELPFVMYVNSKNSLEILNAEEVVLVDEIIYKNDSVYIQTPVFEGYIVAKITDKGFEGSFIKESLDRIVPVKAEKNNQERFPIKKEKISENLGGIWEVVFSENSKEGRYIAKGIFEQNGNQITGTFRTTTGDYRYLEGVVDGKTFKLSTFDGAHAFLFTGSIDGDDISGDFYSGDHWKEPFIGQRNSTYQLPSSNELTFLKEGYNTFEFSFPDLDGNLVSLEDQRFKNKVVVVQIMGTWCPNCLDESKYFSQFYKDNRDLGIEFVSLAFEAAKTPEIAIKRIKRLKEKIGVEYPILLGNYGGEEKTLAEDKLPMLNHVISYPTAVFIDKKGNVRRIHTGFNGPATGQKYLDFKKEFEDFVALLLSEK
mgnify:CR=1 FL=1|tara:strand:+ start:49973 stop:51193 length:1221 start_codon:yes stop_codon:yes gene_type:complete